MVDLFVETRTAENKPLTFTGLALFLGFCSREGIDGYLGFPEFVDSVRRAKAIVQDAYETRLHGPNNSGARFALTNYGWKNASSVDVSSSDGSMSPKGAAIDASELSDEAIEQIMKARRRETSSNK